MKSEKDVKKSILLMSPAYDKETMKIESLNSMRLAIQNHNIGLCHFYEGKPSMCAYYLTKVNPISRRQFH